MTQVSIEPIAPARWPSISVCLIVKNEAANLRPCLDSLEDLASEIIVVDTGSTDGTEEVARALGARVFQFPWVNNFAAARNESIKHATSDWIFWLDADDRLTPASVAQLKRAAASAVCPAYMCLVASRMWDGADNVTEHLRLFRNGLGITFHGAIHETVVPSVAQLQLTLALTDIQIRHTGYTSAEVVKEKSARNLALIDEEMVRDPSRVSLLFYRGQVRANLGNLHGAAQDMQDYLSRSKPLPLFDYQRFSAYHILLQVLDAQREMAAIEQVLEKALGEFPGHPLFLVQAGRLDLALTRPAWALAKLQEATRALQKPVRGIRPSEAWVYLSMAQTYEALNDVDQALSWAKRSVERNPGWEPAGNNLARLYLRRGKSQETIETLSAVLPVSTTPEPWLYLEQILRQQGRWQEAAAAIHEARERGLPSARADELLAKLRATRVLKETGAPPSAGGETEPRLRGLALLARGEHLQAAEQFSKAIELAPSNPDNYRYLAVALRSLGREEEALEAWRLSSLCGVPA